MPAIQIPIEPILCALVILVRVSFMVAFMPLFSDQMTPATLRAALAVGLTIALAPAGVVRIESLPPSIGALAFGLLPEAIVGLTLAMLGRILFAVVQFAGQMAGHEMGFAMASEIDPSTGLNIAVVGQMQYILAVMIFLVSGLDAVFFRALADSFALIPPFAARPSPPLLQLLNDSTSRIFYLGLKLNFPIVGVMLAVNVTIALMARAVTGLNVMMESFPARILAGLAVILLSLPYFAYLLREPFGEFAGQLSLAIRYLAP